MKSTDHHCGKCGLCLSACPVYTLMREEHLSPRAKIQLINAHDKHTLATSKGLQQLISTCLMCGACSAGCPSGVDHYSRFMEMRSTMTKDHGEQLGIRGLMYLLGREKRLERAVTAARIGRSSLPKKLLGKLKIGDIPASSFPTINRLPFRQQVPEVTRPVGVSKGTVLYFTGCATNHLFEEIGHAVLKLLTALGFTVVIPPEQTCCSLPMMFHGASDRAGENIRSNIKSFSGSDIAAIIVDCPTCGSALKDHYPKMAAEHGIEQRKTELIAEKVTDIISFLDQHYDQLHLYHASRAETIPVTYHAPCHLKHSFAPADRLLRRLPQVRYISVQDGHSCCGGGGTFFYEYPDISEQITAKKIDSARQSGAKLWLTDCPVCAITLSGRLDPGDEIKVTHPVCFLASLL